MSTSHRTFPAQERRGIIVVLTGFLLVVIFAFMSLSVDTGRIVLTETELQNAVDAAALAASQEISHAVYSAGQGEGSAVMDSNSIAVAAARTKAAEVAEANGVFVDPATDVMFGKRAYDDVSGDWSIDWGGSPFNVVRVQARRTNADTSAPDGELPLAFGWAVGKESVPITTSATAFVEARDIVVVLDFSGSMNDDSSLVSNLTATQVDEALDAMWSSLRTADPKWPSTSTSKFPATGFGNVNSAAGTYVSSSTTSTILSSLRLTERNTDGTPKFPFPQAGRNSDGTPKNRPSGSTSDSLWSGYVNYVKNLSGTYRKKYGYRTLMDYLQEERERWTQSEDLWRTPHYPFHAIKEGASLFLDFVEELDFGDQVGLVSYATWSEAENSHYDGEVSIDISEDPITDDYDTVDEIQRRHQAGHYDSYTGTGAGIKQAREVLVGVDGSSTDDGHSRYGARPTMIVMTDGLANRSPSGWSMPSGFSWADHTDYDGDGVADYSTTDTNKKYAFYQAVESAQRGITLHSLAVGQDADTALMTAIAHVGGGICIIIPGGTSVSAMEEDLREAFSEIAANVPPSKLVYDFEE